MTADEALLGKRGTACRPFRFPWPMWMRRNGFPHPPPITAGRPLSVREDTPHHAHDTKRPA